MGAWKALQGLRRRLPRPPRSAAGQHPHTREELQRENGRLRKELERLREKVAESDKEIADRDNKIADLERQLAGRKKDSTNSSKPPSSDGRTPTRRARRRAAIETGALPRPAQAGRAGGPSRTAPRVAAAGTRRSNCSRAAPGLPPLRPAPGAAARTSPHGGRTPPLSSYRIAPLALSSSSISATRWPAHTAAARPGPSFPPRCRPLCSGLVWPA